MTCVDCGETFVFSAAEQADYAARGFVQPKRCRSCRGEHRARGARRRPHGRASGSSARQAAAPERPAPAMHPAACTVCGSATEVPFVPDGLRPVYCLPCLKQRTR